LLKSTRTEYSTTYEQQRTKFSEGSGTLSQTIVMVGKNGLEERVIAAMDDALGSHELVKVKFQGLQDEIRPLQRSWR
jgi:RNA-binding protein